MDPNQPQQLPKALLLNPQQLKSTRPMIPSIFPDNSSTHPVYSRDQFLKKLQACSSPLDLNDDSKHIKEKADRQGYLQEFNDLLADATCMSTVIIPHLDLVINMIEKNIFRPLPILKKAGLPGEGVGMEEVPLHLNSVIITRGPSLATFATSVRILLTINR